MNLGDRKKVMNLLKKHNISAYEIIGFLTSALEMEIENICVGEECENDQRNRELLQDLCALSWVVENR